MRILILANSDIGLYKFRKELIEALLSLKHEVYISLPQGEFIDRLVEMGCHFIETKISRHGVNPITDFLLYRKYKSMLKEIKPDIVFSYTIKPNVYGGMACQAYKVPYIVNVTGLGSAIQNGGIIQIISLFLYKIALRKAKMVFLQNNDNKEFLVSRKIIENKYCVLPGSGVNLQEYNVLPYPETTDVNFVFIARIMKEKGIEQYIEAAKYIRKKYKNVHFHVYGSCEEEYENKFNEYLKDKIIVYHGSVNDIISVHKESSCTIHPSYYPEGLSNVLLESAACGRPIITTNHTGCREVVKDGVNGYLVKINNTKDLIEKIELFLHLSIAERRNMGLQGRKLVEEKYDRQIIIDHYLNEIHHL